MSALKSITLVLTLALGAATLADADGRRGFRQHQAPTYSGTMALGHLYRTPAGNLYLTPPSVPAYDRLLPGVPAHPLNSATPIPWATPRPAPSYQGASPACPRFFC
jgi:hypothetical protein